MGKLREVMFTIVISYILYLQLLVAIIGGETHRFRALIDLYREAGKRAGRSYA